MRSFTLDTLVWLSFDINMHKSSLQLVLGHFKMHLDNY